jgi:hypothetical protein
LYECGREIRPASGIDRTLVNDEVAAAIGSISGEHQPCA